MGYVGNVTRLPERRKIPSLYRWVVVLVTISHSNAARAICLAAGKAI